MWSDLLSQEDATCLSALTDPLFHTKQNNLCRKMGWLISLRAKGFFCPKQTTKFGEDQRLKRIALDCEPDHENLLLKSPSSPANNLLNFQQNEPHPPNTSSSVTRLADNPSHKNCNTQFKWLFFFPDVVVQTGTMKSETSLATCALSVIELPNGGDQLDSIKHFYKHFAGLMLTTKRQSNLSNKLK